MAKRRNADLFKVLIAQIWQDGKANIILGKSLSVLPETELTQPVCYLLHSRPPGFDLFRSGPEETYHMLSDLVEYARRVCTSSINSSDNVSVSYGKSLSRPGPSHESKP